jgi:hypothetical protein
MMLLLWCDRVKRFVLLMMDVKRVQSVGYF